jgi:ribosomal protein S18 acetylase RimI-like enzyme
VPPAEGKGVRAADDPTDEDRFVGQVMLHGGVGKNRSAKLGISLDPRWWGQGLGTEAVRWIVDYAFEEFGLHRIGLDTNGSNTRALGSYKKACVGSSFTTERYISYLRSLVDSWKRAASGSRSGVTTSGTTACPWVSSVANGKPRRLNRAYITRGMLA